MLEEDLRNKFRDPEFFPHTSVLFVEKRRDTPDGQPDIAIRTHGTYYVPVELKIGKEPIKKLRPSQRRWFKLCILEGGTPLVCTLKKKGTTDIVDFVSVDFNLKQTGVESIKFDHMNLSSVVLRINKLIIP